MCTNCEAFTVFIVIPLLRQCEAVETLEKEEFLSLRKKNVKFMDV